jgi:hypothetical protein
VPETAFAATDLDLISFLEAIPVGEAFSAGVARMSGDNQVGAGSVFDVA